MVASGVGQYSINVKSNLKDFYGELSRSKKTMDQLVSKKYQLEIDSKQLDKLRDKGQRIAAEMKELRQQKTEIKLGTREVENADAEIKSLDKRIASLNRQKLAVEADIQPIRTANTELYKVNSEIDRINNKKIKIDVSESLTKAGNSISSMGDGILKAFNPLTSKLNQMIGFGLINNLVGKGLNMITNSLSGAVSRVDTLNNYTKVMSNMNIAQEDAEKSRERLVEGLNGLPTTLDAGASAVQRFTSKNEDIKRSTEMFIGLNDAILAGGATQSLQDSALEMASQAYSKGKFELDEWKALLLAMPAQVKQVAASFNTNADGLYESMKEGTISIEEFMDRIILLDKEGDNGFKSFNEQAKNAVDGVQTGVARMNTAVTRGVAKIITKVDEVGKSRGLGGISDMLGKIGSFFEKGLGNIADMIEKNQDAIFGFIDKLVIFLQSVDYESFFKGLLKGLKEMGNAAKSVFNFFKPLLSLLGDKNIAEGLGTLIPRMFMLGTALKIIGLSTKGMGGVLGILQKFTKFKLPSFSFGKGDSSSLPLQSIGIEQVKSLGIKLLAIAGLSANVYLAAKAIQEVTKIENMDGIYEKLASIAIAVSGMGLITVAVDKVNKLAGTSMITGLITIAAISAEIYLMSLSLEKLASIDISFVDIQKKIGTIALVVAEMTVLTGLIGAIMATGIGAIALGAGILAVGALALELMLLAETIKQLDEKIPSDFGTVQSKINNMLNVLKAITESNLSTIGSLFDSIVAGFTTGSIIKTLDNMIQISEKLKDLNTKGSSINDEKTNRVISSIQSILNELSLDGGFWSSVGKAFKNKADSAVYTNAIYSIDSIILLAERIKKIEVQSINSAKIKENIKAIQRLFPLIDTNSFTDKGFKPINPNFVDSIDTTVYYLRKLKDRISDFTTSKLDINAAIQEIANIKGFSRLLTAKSWKEFSEGLVNKELLVDLSDAIGVLSSIGEKMSGFIVSVPENGIAQDALVSLRGSLRLLQSQKWEEFSDGFVSSKTFNGLGATLNIFENISNSMKSIAKNSVETGVVQGIVLNIKGLLRMLKVDKWTEYSDGFVTSELLAPSINALTAINKIAEKMYELSSVNLESGKAQDVLVNLRGALRMLKAEAWIEFANGFVDKNLLEPLILSLEAIKDISKTLKEISDINLNSDATNKQIASIRGVLRMLVIEKWEEYSSGFIDKNTIEPVTLALDTLKFIAEKMLVLQNLNLDSGKINEEIAKVKGCLRMLRADSWIDFQNGFIESKTLGKAVDALKVLKTITDRFAEIQNLNAEEVNQNIARLKGLLRSLKSEKWSEYVDSMVSKEDLQKYADLIETLKTAISRMSEIKSDEIDIAGIQKNITGFMGIMRRLTIDNFPDVENVISSDSINKATSTLDSLIAFGNKLPTLANIEFSEGAVISRLLSMKRIIDTMNEFSIEEGMENPQGLIQVFIDMANKMNEMSTTTFQPIGKSWGAKVIQGFKESDVPKNILSIIDGLVSKLIGKESMFKSIGAKWGNSLKNAFNSSVQGLGSGIDNQINSMANKANTFARLGNAYGQYLNDGFNNALVMLDNTVSSKVSNLQQAINNVKSSANNSSSSNSSRKPSPVVLASGGKVSSPTGFARIVDSYEQPVIGNGEGIIPKKVMDRIGMPFFEQLRRGQISPTFANLSKSISNTTSSVVNNIYNNTTTNQQMSVYTTAAPDVVHLSNRRLR